VSAAQRALELDPAEAEAYAVLASAAVSNRSWLEAESYFREARRLSPNSPTIRLWYSEMLAKLGLLERALDEVGVALDVDPLYTPALGNAGHQLATAGRVSEAAELFQRAWDLGLEAMFVWFGNFYVAYMEERLGDAEQWLGSRPVANGIDADRALLAFGRQPDRERQASLVAATLASLDKGMDVREAAMYLAAAGAIDEAFEYLDSAADSGWIATESLWNDWTRDIRRDSRFSELVHALGMVPYWEVHGAPDGCGLENDALTCN
jgi:tetratricopeptide (TPR) repeat protein